MTPEEEIPVAWFPSTRCYQCRNTKLLTIDGEEIKCPFC